MSAYKGKSRKIKDAVVQLMTGLTYDAGTGAEPAFVSVLDSTGGEFDGYPALRVLPAADGVVDTKGAVSQQDREQSLMLLVHIPLENPTGDALQVQQAAINRMLDYGDIIIDTLDEADFTAGGNVADGGVSLGTLVINTKKVGWEVLALKTGAVLLCRIDTSIKYSKDL